MIKQLHFKSWLLMMLLLIGGGKTAWADEVTYTVTSKSTVSVSGTAPTGSSASYTQTYQTAMQITGNNSATLTLSGYEGYRVKGIKLSMKSNSKGGSGYLKYSIDGGSNYTYLVGSSNAGLAFNNSAWHGSYSTSYVDVTKSVDFVATENNVIFEIGADANSLYCQSYTITYEVASSSPLSSIALSGNYPTTFREGDAFSHAGMTVTATYEDETTKDVTSKAVFTGYDMDNAGNQTVTVSYTEGEVTKTAQYNINVMAPATITSITLSGNYQTVFTEGDEFNHEGLTVTANYDDDTNSDVTDEAEFSTPDMATPGVQDVTVTYNNLQTTYQITVNAIPTHNVTFNVNGATTSTSYKEGATIAFPDDPADINGMTFVGWYGSTYSNASVAPEFVTSATMGTSDVTYYAVFADSDQSVTGWELTSLSNMSASDIFVIAADIYTMKNDGGTSEAPGYAEITVKDNRITSEVTDAMKWKVTGNTTDGFVFYPNGSTESWLYCSTTADKGSNNNLRVGTGNRKTWIFNNSGYLVTKDNYVNRYLSFYATGQDFRGYIDTNNGAFVPKFYKYVAASYSNYCTTVSALPKPVITLSTESIEMTWGDADKKLTATAKLGDEDFEGTITLTPSSSNLTIAADGTITCNVPGDYTVTASIAAKDGEYQAANDVVCNVTVNKKVATITLNETTAELDIADDTPTTTLVATVSSGGNVIDDVTVTWSSDDPEVATVDEDGVVTAVAKGSATISASFTSDKYNISSDETCTVTVINSASGVIDLTKTGEVTFSNFSGLGNSYTSKDPYTFGGYDWTVENCLSSTEKLQLRKNDGVLTSPTIKSKKGFVVSVEMNTNTVTISDGTNSSTEGTLTVEDATATITFATGSSYAVISSITITPIKDDRTLAFTEPTTEVLVNGTVTNTASVTPAGTITYTSSDETVATVDADGKVTGVKIGTATITATVAEDADYNVASDQYDITVNGISAATNISLSATDTGGPVSLSELKVGDAGHFSASYVKATGEFTATVAYTSSNTDVLTIGENGAFTPAKGGTSTVTVTITPDDTDHYVEVSKDFVVTVLNVQKGTTALTIQNNDEEEQSSGSTLFGNNISLKAALATDYDGTVTATQTNSAIATVAITGENITITPKAVGTTTITFTAPETANFDGQVSKTYNLTVTAPEAKTESGYVPAVVVLNETFSKCDSNGGNGGDGFAPSSNTSISSADDVTDVENWTLTKAYEANECLKFGSSGTAGSATTPTLSVSAGTTYVLTFNAAPWSEESATMTVNVTGGTIKGNASATTAIMTQKKWNAYEYEILATAAEMTITFSCSAKRFFLDEVKVEKPEVAPAIPDAKIPSSGYGTFCCEYPLDFTEENSEYKAYAVTDVDGTNVTFTRITGKISGGVPFILYGTPGTYHLKVADESTVTPAGNLLVGTLAPTYVETVNGSYTNFGMSGGKFKKINTGVMPANKAYLPIANTLLSGSGAREFTFIFNDGATTGVSEVTSRTAQQPDAIYDLQGRKVETPKRGLYIINGKKVMIK